MQKLVDGKLVDLTAEEIAAREAECDKWAAEMPQRLGTYLETAYKPLLLQPVTLHGITIIPDDKTLNRLNNKIQAMRHRNDPAETCTWIGENGPVPLTLAQLEDLGMEANDQWQSIFDALPGIQADIISGAITDVEGVDAALAAVGA